MGHDGGEVRGNGWDGERWAELVGRLCQLAQGVGDVEREGASLVPEWPADRSRTVRVALLEAATALRRARVAAVEGLELARLAGLGVVAALLLLAAPAAAQELRHFGDETVGTFRQWSSEQQVFYLLGALGRSAMLGRACRSDITLGEYQAALKFDPRMRPSDPLPLLIVVLEVRHGCEWPATSEERRQRR